MKTYEIIIIGGGPAGYTAAIYCARGGATTALFQGDLPGGQMSTTSWVHNFPGFPETTGPDLMDQMLRQCVKNGVEIVNSLITNIEKKDDLFFLTDRESNIHCSSIVILATGATHKKLCIPSETEYENRGISYCATCDGGFFSNKHVAVIGGGNTAVEEALYLSKIVKQVHLIHRRDELRAEHAMQTQLFSKTNISYIWNSQVMSFQGDEHGLNKIIVSNQGEEKEVLVEGAFVAIGYKPLSHLVCGLVDLTAEGYVKINSSHETSLKGMYAAGDIHDKEYRQAVTASAFGCIAAHYALKSLNWKVGK